MLSSSFTNDHSTVSIEEKSFTRIFTPSFLVFSTKIEDEFLAVQRIKEQLKGYLPDYMIPKKMKFLEQLPVTNNGKVDRKILGGLL